MRCVLAMTVAIVMAFTSGCGAAGCKSGFSCHLTPDNAGGVRPRMSPQQVQRRWHIPIKAPEVIVGSNSVAYAAVCDGATRGWARFAASSRYRPLTASAADCAVRSA